MLLLFRLNLPQGTPQAQPETLVAQPIDVPVGYPTKRRKERFEQPVMRLLSDIEAEAPQADEAISKAFATPAAPAKAERAQVVATLSEKIAQAEAETQQSAQILADMQADIEAYQGQETLRAYEALMRRIDEQEIEMLLLA